MKTKRLPATTYHSHVIASRSKGVPGLDFAGWHMIGTVTIAAGYAMVSVLMMLAAWRTDWMRTGREQR